MAEKNIRGKGYLVRKNKYYQEKFFQCVHKQCFMFTTNSCGRELLQSFKRIIVHCYKNKEKIEILLICDKYKRKNNVSFCNCYNIILKNINDLDILKDVKCVILHI